jgi:hypothetical protein
LLLVINGIKIRISARSGWKSLSLLPEVLLEELNHRLLGLRGVLAFETVTGAL